MMLELFLEVGAVFLVIATFALIAKGWQILDRLSQPPLGIVEKYEMEKAAEEKLAEALSLNMLKAELDNGDALETHRFDSEGCILN